LTLSIITGLILSAGIYLISDPLVNFLFSSREQDIGNLQLTEMALILSIYGISLIPMGPFRAQQSFLYAAKDPNTVGWLLFIATFTTLILIWPLVTLFSAPGLGIAFTIGISIGLLFGFRFTNTKQLARLKTPNFQK
jgi:peptidoglycan biosynthesis protein MviN/MurJ (putative lipid II flippase)